MKVIAGVFVVGLGGSVLFTLPQVVDPTLDNDGTLGFTLLDLMDHWAFGYGLLLCGMLEVLILGWVYDINKLIAFINQTARFKLGLKFKILVRFILPMVIISIIVWSVALGEKCEMEEGLYGNDFVKEGQCKNLYLYAFFGWIVFSLGGTIILTALKRRKQVEALP